MAEELRQGEGTKRTIKGVMPTQRVDGTPYEHGDEDYFLFFVTGNPDINPADESHAEYPPGIAVELEGGQFTEAFDPDTVSPGLVRVWYKTVDVVDPSNPERKLISAPSEVLEFQVLPPLAEPLPPVVQ